MNKYIKLVSDTILMTIGGFSSKILVFLLLPIYTYILTTEEYGVADLFVTTINLLIPILTLSIAEATFRFAFDKDINQNKNLLNSFLILLLSCVVLIPIMLLLSFWNDSFLVYGGFFFWLYFSCAAHTILFNYARGTDHIRVFVLSNVLYTMILVSLNILFLTVFRWQLKGYLLSMICSYFGSSLFILVALKVWKACKKTYFDFHLLKTMLKFSIPMIVSTTAWWAMNSLDKYMIINFFGMDASGLFGVAQKIPTIITVFSSIFIQAWQISAISVHGQKDSNEFYTNVYKVYEVGLFIAAAGIIFLTKPLAAFLFQKDYFSAFEFVPVLVLSGIFSCLASFLQSPFVAAKKSSVLLQSTLIGAMFNIGANYILMMEMGVIGAAYATLFSFMLTWAIRLWKSRKYVVLNIEWKYTLPSMILLISEAILVSLDIDNSMIYSAIIFVLILLMRFNTIKELLSSVIVMIKKNR